MSRCFITLFRNVIPSGHFFMLFRHVVPSQCLCIMDMVLSCRFVLSRRSITSFHQVIASHHSVMALLRQDFVPLLHLSVSLFRHIVTLFRHVIPSGHFMPRRFVLSRRSITSLHHIIPPRHCCVTTLFRCGIYLSRVLSRCSIMSSC